MGLEMALDLSCGGGDRHSRTCIEIVARPLVAHPRPAIPGTPKREIGLRIVGAGDPDRSTAGLPLVTRGPRLGSWLARRRHGISLPRRLPGFGVKRRDEAAHAKLAARNADHHLAVSNQRRQRHVISLSVVLDLRVPQFVAGL